MKKSICPNCGAVLPTVEKGQTKVQCQYCGTLVENKKKRKAKDETADASNLPITDKILPFTKTEDEAREEFIRMLITSDLVPLDIFETFEITKIEKSFRKMFFFRGQYSIEWDCVEVRSIRKTRRVYKDGREQTEPYYEKEYIPRSGRAGGRFSVLSGKRTYDFYHTFLVTPKKYKPSLIDDDARILDDDLTERKAWDNMENELESMAETEMYSKLPIKRIDLNYDINYDKVNAESLLVSFWNVSFLYKNETYNNRLRDDGYIREGKLPIDKEEEKKRTELEKLKTEEGSSWGTLLISLYAIALGGLTWMYDSQYCSFDSLVYAVVGVFLTTLIPSLYVYNKRRKMYKANIKSYNDKIAEIDKQRRDSNTLCRARSAARILGFDISVYEGLKEKHQELPTRPKSSYGLVWIVLVIVTVLSLIIGYVPKHIADKKWEEYVAASPYYTYQTDLQITGFPDGTRMVVEEVGEKSYIWCFDENGELNRYQTKGLKTDVRLDFSDGKCVAFYTFSHLSGRTVTKKLDVVYKADTQSQKEEIYVDGGLWSSVTLYDDGSLKNFTTSYHNLEAFFSYRGNSQLSKTKGGNYSVDGKNVILPLLLFSCGNITMPRYYTLIEGTETTPMKYKDDNSHIISIYYNSDELPNLETTAVHLSDVENIGYRKDVKSLEVWYGKHATVYDFDTSGNLCKITDNGYSSNEYYSFSNGLLVSLDDVPNEGEYSYRAERKQYRYEYRTKKHEIIDGGISNVKEEVEVYKVRINTNSEESEIIEKALKAANNERVSQIFQHDYETQIGTLHYDEHKRLVCEGMFYTDGDNAMFQGKPTIAAIALLHSELRMPICLPTNYELLEGSTERPIRIKVRNEEIVISYR